MSAAISIYGRLGQDPRAIQTRTGKAMTTASVAVDIPNREEGHTEWFGLVAFGEAAERLAKHCQGEMVAVTGRLQLNTWQGRDGNARTQWQVLVDSLVSARTVRPAAGRKAQAQRRDARRREAPEPEFNDALPF